MFIYTNTRMSMVFPHWECLKNIQVLGNKLMDNF